jgi:hypothetical protein
MRLNRLTSFAFFASVLIIRQVSPIAEEEDPRWQVTPNVNDIVDWNVQPNSTALAKAMNDAAEYVQWFKVPGGIEEWEYRRPQVESALRRAIGLERLPEATSIMKGSTRCCRWVKRSQAGWAGIR